MSGAGAIRVGLLGMGVVGRGVARILQERADYFRDVRGVDLTLRRVAVRDLVKPRDVVLPEGTLTDRPEAVIDDPEVDVVIEVIGGIQPAKDLCLRALEAGKDLVTANKTLLAEQGQDIFSAASRQNVGLGFGASVCGGIPIIRSLTDGLVANQIESIYGILNGTTNYVLTRMADEGGDFDEMLAQAQEKGYAEADPTLDIDGTDAAQKLTLLCRIGFGVNVTPDQIFKEGISHVAPIDIDFAKELGFTIKLLAIAKAAGDRIEARVHPVMVPSGALLANIKDEFNAVEVVGSAVGPQVFYGRGAGQSPTASAVISDLLELAERRLTGRASRARFFSDLPPARIVPPDEVDTGFYCRFTVYDRPGVLAQISRVFADEEISIASVVQHGRSETEDGTVPLIMTTHEAPAGGMREAVVQIDRLRVVTGRPQIIRIEKT